MILYLITNKINGKQYVGQTRNGLARRWEEHCKAKSAIGGAIRKHGRENFVIAAITTAASLEALNELEARYIQEMNTRVPNGYNIHPGGRNHEWTPERRAQFSAKRMGEGNPRYGCSTPATARTKAKISAANRGKRRSPDTEFPSSPVVCVTTGQRFDTVSAAAKAFDLWPAKISLVCSGKRKSTGGLRFRYAKELENG